MATTTSWAHQLIRLCMIAYFLAKHAAATTIIKTQITSTNIIVDEHTKNLARSESQSLTASSITKRLGSLGGTSSVLVALHSIQLSVAVQNSVDPAASGTQVVGASSTNHQSITTSQSSSGSTQSSESATKPTSSALSSWGSSSSSTSSAFTSTDSASDAGQSVLQPSTPPTLNGPAGSSSIEQSESSGKSSSARTEVGSAGAGSSSQSNVPFVTNSNANGVPEPASSSTVSTIPQSIGQTSSQTSSDHTVPRFSVSHTVGHPGTESSSISQTASGRTGSSNHATSSKTSGETTDRTKSSSSMMMGSVSFQASTSRGSFTGTGIAGLPLFSNSSTSAQSSTRSSNGVALGTGAVGSSSREATSSLPETSSVHGTQSSEKPESISRSSTSSRTAKTSSTGTSSSKSEDESNSSGLASSSSRIQGTTDRLSKTNDDSSSEATETNMPGTTTSGGTVTSMSSGQGSKPTDSLSLHEKPTEVTLQTVAWRNSASMLSCKPPCTLTLPPIPLNTPAVLEYPAITTSICTNVGGIIYTYLTTISVSAATISELELKPVAVSSMTSGQPAVTSAAEPDYPLGQCSMALPAGSQCIGSGPPDSTDGNCGMSNGGTRCPGMQCCSSLGLCGTDKGACAKESGCMPNFGACWPDGQSSFLPMSEVFGSATVSSSCPTGFLPTVPTAGPLIAGAIVQTSGLPPPPAEESSSTAIVVLPPGQTTPGSGSQTGLPLIPLPVPLPGPPSLPRLCGACGVNLAPFIWSLDLGCSGPLCDAIKPKGGGCFGLFCKLDVCLIGCGKGGGGGGGGGKKPPGKPDPPENEDDPTGPPSPPDGPDPPEDEDKPTKLTTDPFAKPTAKPTQSASKKSTSQIISESECETTKTATEVTEYCNVVTQFANFGSTSSVSAPRTTCTSTKIRVTQGCKVTATTTSKFDSCSKTQTATGFTKFCTESVSGGVTFTPCTKTVSTVFEGCSVTATTTSIVDEACRAMVTLAPDDPHGEFGSLPSNDTCPFYPGIEVSVLEDQGQDGKEENGTCALFNGTRPTIDDDQGSGSSKSCKSKNSTASSGGSCPVSIATLIQGPDGAEDGTEMSCPMNFTMPLEPDGILEGEDAPSCNVTAGFNVTYEMALGQGEDGYRNQSCALNATLEVDNEQGEDGERPGGDEDDEDDESGGSGGRGGRGGGKSGCPVPPDGVIISPLADQGDYAPMNESSCPDLDPRFPVSPLDEQGDDLMPEDSSSSTQKSKTSSSSKSKTKASSTSSVNSTLQSEIWSAFISKATASTTASINSTLQSEIWSAFISKATASNTCATPTSSGLGFCTLAIPEAMLTAGQAKTIHSSNYKHPQVTERSEGSQITGPEDIDLGKSKIEAEASSAQSWALQGRDDGNGDMATFPRSCSCQSQSKGQVVTATTVCGTPMCPNWGTWSSMSFGPKTLSISISLKSNKPQKPEPTSVYSPCLPCNIPKSTQYGSCSTWKTWSHIYIPPGMQQVPGPTKTSCKCEFEGGTTKVNREVVCGQTVCPNQAEQISLKYPNECPWSACVPPLNPNFGRCALKTHLWMARDLQSMTGYECNCDMQPSTRVNVQTGCNGRPVCPNQMNMVSNVPSWTDIVPQGEQTKACWTYLPSLLFFGSCTLTSKPVDSAPPFLGGKDACYCNVKDDPEWSAIFEPKHTACGGGWLCPNSDPIKVERRSVGLNESFEVDDGTWHGMALKLPATATAVVPLMPMVTDATPGSVPLAASEPTKVASNLEMRG